MSPRRMEAVDHRVEARLFGALRLSRGGLSVGAADLGGPKPRQILEVLLVHVGRPVSKELLIDELWDGRPPEGARSTLESYVSVLRRKLGAATGATNWLRTVNRGYLVERSAVSVDLDDFERLSAAARSAPSAEAHDLLTQALAMTEEPMLDGELATAWVERLRHETSQHILVVGRLAAEAALATGRFQQAEAWAARSLAADPLDERAWTIRVLAFEGQGRVTEAMSVFEACRRTLRDELGCAPSQPLRDAFTRLLTLSAPENDVAEVFQAVLALHQGMVSRRDGSSVGHVGEVPAHDAAMDEARRVIATFMTRAVAA